MRRIIAFVDHEIGYRLLEKMAFNQKTFSCELVAVVTTQDNGNKWWPGVENLCQKEGIPLHIYSDPFIALNSYNNIDWYFLLSWKHIIPKTLIDRPKCGAINLHYSLLPEYRGVYPINWAIIEGKEETGITYHMVNEDIDAGVVLFQRCVPIMLSDTARSLQLRMDETAYELFDKVIEFAITDEKPKLLPAVDKGSYRSYADFQSSNELNLNQEYRAIDLLNLLRGKTFTPESKNIYIVDPITARRIYISVNLDVEN